MKSLKERFNSMNTDLDLINRIGFNSRSPLLHDIQAVIKDLDMINFGTKENIRKLLIDQLNNFDSGYWEDALRYTHHCVNLAHSMYKWHEVKYNEHEKSLITSILMMTDADMTDNSKWCQVIECYYIFRNYFYLKKDSTKELVGMDFFNMYEILDND